ncbi:N-acetylglucosamine kinase [Labrys neptuniae]|uniref:N-acetylglucosamine kinase n=1 Tax=Labrys neptuniae TaxID=376174 RepID=UPI00288F9432|nr:N-acetylglucosamine kinase [Labrys neptuniae]MDT3381061.1 N-acetylglucosamine kinase [Labrys neptuniae]
MMILGVDGGGTSCRAALATAQSQIIGRAKAGSANIRTDLNGACESIMVAVGQAFAAAGQDPAHIPDTPVVLGLAGANIGTYAAELRARLPFRRCLIESDVLIALEGAIGAGDGAIGILGTGSHYLARQSGEIRRLGGWGFLLGDQGSGARIGRDLLEEALLAHDGIAPHTSLLDAVLAAHGNDPQAIVEFTKSAQPRDFGTFAPMVFDYLERGDPAADRIVERAVSAVEASLDALALANATPRCLLGGLATLVGPRLPPKHRERLVPPLQDALGGAVSMAARLFGLERSLSDGKQGLMQP